MKKRIVYCLFFILVTCSFSVRAIVTKPWTFLVYMAATDDLNSPAISDLKDMMKVGSNENVNIIVYLTIQQEGQLKRTKKLYIEKGNMHQIGPDMHRDSGDVSTLAEALQWACVDYPSDHIGVVLWGHGGGPLNRGYLSRGICYDYDSENYLTDRDCFSAFSWIKGNVRGDRPFDIIVCDACFSGSLEMAYTFSSFANYFIASEDVITRSGFQYSTLLRLLSTQNFDPLSFAKAIVDVYGKGSKENSNYTLSLIDLNVLDLLVNNVNAVAQVLSSNLRGKNRETLKNAIKKCATTNGSLMFYDKRVYVDLCQFYRNLLKFAGSLKLSESITLHFKQLLVNGIELFSSVVNANVTSKNYKQAGGLSIYFSRNSIDHSYYGLYWTEKNPKWLDFLEAYLL